MNRELPHQPLPPFRYCRHLFFFALVLLFANSARATCNAAWTYTIHGDSVFLQSTDTASSNRHYWSFNGTYNTSNQTSLVQVYPNYGTYHICQYVYTPGTNCSDSLCQNITIPPPTSPCHLNTAWTYTTHGDTVYVTASDTNSANHHYWTFGTYTSTSNSLTASYVFPQGGTYRICLHEYTPNTNCVDSFCQNVTVAPINPCTLTAIWQSVTHGDTVNFYAGSSNTTAHYYWNFGDGSPYVTGTTTPTHVYANAGTYHVCLYDYVPNTTCADSFCHDVIVTAQACHVSAAWTYSIHGDTVFLHSADTLSANNHYWTFGGTSYVSGTNVYHVFPNYGVNRICLHVYTPNTTCVDSSCNTITLPYPCHVNAAWTYSNTAGNNVHFFAADTSLTVSRLWTFGDGTSNSFTSTPVKTYSAPGTYHVCLRVYGAGSNCVDSFCSTITVGTACNVTAGWQSTTHLDTARFYATSNGSTASYSWNFGDGHTGTGIYPTHVYAQAGTYHVCLYVSVTSANCIDSFCSTVTIASGCHVSAAWTYTIHGDTVFLHSADTLSSNHHYWSFNGVYSTSNQTSLIHVYTGPGVYRICQYVYTPGTSCVDSSCNTITIANNCNVHAAFQFYTVRDSVHFYNTNNDSTVHLDWNFGDGNFGFGTNPWHGYATAGTYHVCCYAYTSGCIDSFCTTVTVGSGCHVSAAWTYTIHGDTVFLHSVDTLSTNNHYWTFGTGSTYTSGTSVFHVYPNYGVNRICLHVYTPGTICSDSSCNTITLVSPCNVHASWQSTSTGDTAYFYAATNSGATYYNWHYGDGTSGTGATSTHVYAQPGTYRVCLYAYNNTNCLDSFCNTVTVSNTCHISAAWTYTVHGDTVFLHSADTVAANRHYWSVGTPNYLSGTSVSYVFPGPGTYHVCLYAYIPGTNCSDSSCNNITISTACSVHAVWQSYSIGDTAHFFAGSNSGTITYTWSFGDGLTGTGSTPLHTYSHPGTYHVCLYAASSLGCRDSFCNSITVTNGCRVSAAWTYSIHGDTVFLHSSDTSSANNHYWNFGTPNYSSGTSVTHVFNGPGVYQICLHVYTPGTTCSDSSCNTITITNSCLANAAWTYTASGNVVNYHAADTNSSVYLDWNYGDGSYGFGQNTSHTYAQPGTYHVCLYAYTGTNCIDSFCNTVTVGSGCHVSATWTYTVHGDTVFLHTADTLSANHHYWIFDGNTSTYASGTSVTHVFNSLGSHHVCLYVYTPGTNCADSSCNNITITNPCNVHAIWQSYVTGDSAHFFAGGNTGATVYYNWSFGDGHTGTGANPVHAYTQAGTYHVCLYAYNSTNCIDSFCNTITIAGGCNITSSWTYAEYGDSVHFTSADTNHVAHHYWNFGDGHTGSGFDISHVYSAPGIYNVCSYVYIPGTNCIDSTCNTITVSGTCSITAALNFINVSHDTVAFYALFQDSATNFVWIYGDGTTSNGAYAVHGYPVPGTYHVCLHAFIPGTPCSDSVCIDINVGAQCAVTAAWAYIPRGNDSVQFYAADPDPNATHSWNFGDGSSASGSYAAHTFANSGTYHVCLFVSVPNSTCSDSLCKEVNAVTGINDLSSAYPTISLRPNPFSQYTIMNIDGPASNYEVHVYDMIGQEVRTVTGVNNSIMIDRGTLASGIYTYAVTADKMIIGKGKMSIE
jgi:PKD repeat protein